MIEVLVRVIASGKSTYARNRADEGAIVVNADAVVTMLHKGKYTGYDKALKPLYKALEIEMAIAAILAGRDVVIRWRGQDSDYTATTIVEPDDNKEQP